MRFIDTNVFVRYLTNDHPELAASSASVLESLATGENDAMTSEAVVLELEHVLSSKRNYALPRDNVAQRLRVIFRLPGLAIPNLGDHQEALDCYAATDIDYTDCLSVAQMRRQSITEIISFDHDFDRFGDITRVEP